MSHIDFAIGFVLIISTILILFYFVTNSISNNINDFSSDEIRESSFSLGDHLFSINDDKSLISTFRELQAVLSEINSTDHTEEIRISIKPQVSKVKVYNNTMDEIISSSNDLPGETIVSFTLGFAANENKVINVIYYGDFNSVNYLTPENNISLRMLSAKDLSVVSQQKCYYLKSHSYNVVKTMFGFKNDFRLDLENCNYGPQPGVGNVIIRNIPVIFESENGLMSSKLARLSVW
ncbi:hypothetical protein A3K64_00330 [Candidatus Micrarchaeota archaeon RBG_16_36_9]|nr:MAG: hypothetical protein A3K64_00330 [Candidatus Micrarchaeota archaeon RBG_16_36_9]